jgi:hypothetical protein
MQAYPSLLSSTRKRAPGTWMTCKEQIRPLPQAEGGGTRTRSAGQVVPAGEGKERHMW